MVEQTKSLESLIREAMHDCGKSGDPRNYVLLSRWGMITDCDGQFDVKASLPTKLDKGNHIWVTYAGNDPKLHLVLVLEDQGARIWVEDPEHTVQFSVPRVDAHPLPIPLRPTLIHKSELRDYLGEHAERFWDSVLGCRVMRV